MLSPTLSTCPFASFPAGYVLDLDLLVSSFNSVSDVLDLDLTVSSFSSSSLCSLLTWSNSVMIFDRRVLNLDNFDVKDSILLSLIKELSFVQHAGSVLGS